MGIIVTLPTKTLDVSGSLSLWFAAHNPMTCKVERQDFVVDSIADDGTGKVKVTSTTSIDPVPLFNDLIYINSGPYVGVYKVLSGTSTDFILDLAFSSTTATGFFNLNTARSGYRIKIVFTKYNPLTSLYETDLGTGQFTPNAFGVCECDVKRYAQNSVSMIDEFNFDAINKRDTNISAILKAEFIETWFGIAEETIQEVFVISAVNAAMQPMNKGGSNMKRYVTEETGSDLAEWLTDFEVPTFVEGFPFDLSFIYSHLMIGELNPKVSEITYDVNGSTGLVTRNISRTQIDFVNRLTLSGGYAAGTKQVEVYLENGTNLFTKSILVDVISCIPRNTIYLKWIGSNGSWNYFPFSISQTRGINSKAGTVFSKFYSDIETQKETGKFLGKDSVPEIICGNDQVKDTKRKGLDSLICSPQVEMYVGIIDDVHTWKTVRLTKFNWNPKTNHSRHSIELTLQLLDTQTQTQ